MNLDAICAAALARMQERDDERIAEFRRQCEREAETTRRSWGQKWRHLREELCGR